MRELRPHCQKIAVVGSVRRRREQVKDVDFVVLTNTKEAFRRRCLQAGFPLTDGATNFSMQTTHGVQLDFFFAEPEKRDLLETIPSNWGSLMVCRTGSREHNIYLVEHAKTLGLEWRPYVGVIDHFNLIASATEEDIFKALKLAYVEPQDRER